MSSSVATSLGGVALDRRGQIVHLGAGGALMIKAARVACICGVIALVGCADESPKAAAPKTGGLMLRNDGVGLVKTTTANGTSMKLDGQFENAAIARRNPDGTLTVECHDDQPQAEAFMSTTATTARAPELQ
jgi:hypothetical protein